MVEHTPQTRQRLQHHQEYKQTSCTLLVTKDVWIVKQHATEPVGAFNTNKTRRRLQHQEAFQTDELHFPCDQRRLDNEQKRTNKPRSKNEHHNDKGRHKATEELITTMKIAKRLEAAILEASQHTQRHLRSKAKLRNKSRTNGAYGCQHDKVHH